MKKKKIVVVPSDPIELYIKNGMSESEIREYYNPHNCYEEVYAISAFEKGIYKKYGMTIIGAKRYNLNKYLKKIKPDIIRAYDGFKSADYALFARNKNTPVVISIHDARKELMHRSLVYADAIICMSEIVKNNFCELFPDFDEKRIFVLPNRVDTKLFRANADEVFNKKNNEKYRRKYHILHVGRKSREKNIDTLVKAMKELPEEYEVIFSGRGSEEEYRKLAISEGVSDRCHFLDHIDHSELPKWYTWCDCMCTPSRVEGFGIVFIEAASCGSCIITSNIPPMSEYLTHNKSAYLVDEYNNPSALAKAIKECCENSELRNTLSSGAQKVSERFSKEAIDQQESELMNNLSMIAIKKKSLQVYYYIFYQDIIKNINWIQYVLNKRLKRLKIYNLFQKSVK